MKNTYSELNPWHKRQAALIHHFTSMEYLKSLLPDIDNLLKLTDQMLDDRTHLDATGRALAGWKPQDTASHFSTYAYPALVEFRQSIVEDIALRAIERYRVAGENQCERMLSEYAHQMIWATFEQEEVFRKAATQVFRRARELSNIVARPTTMDDCLFWMQWNDHAKGTRRIPKFRVRTDIIVRSHQVPPRTGIYVPKDEPMAALQFAWTGGYGALGPAMAPNAAGRSLFQQMGRNALWGDAEALYRFLDANRHLSSYGWSHIQADLYELAPGQVSGAVLDFLDCEWNYVERVRDEFEDIDGTYAGVEELPSRPSREPAGQPVPVSGWWYTPAGGSTRYYRKDEVFPSFENSDWGDTFWIWAADQKPPRLG
ncbi:MAG: hypothetical protein ACN6RG_02085 [Stenotrophomonas sp.]